VLSGKGMNRADSTLLASLAPAPELIPVLQDGTEPTALQAVKAVLYYRKPVA